MNQKKNQKNNQNPNHFRRNVLVSEFVLFQKTCGFLLKKNPGYSTNADMLTRELSITFAGNVESPFWPPDESLNNYL